MSKKKVGLALAGGGGKGAYQIGVWRALRETGLEQYITSVSGTSIGGINAALVRRAGSMFVLRQPLFAGMNALTSSVR